MKNTTKHFFGYGEARDLLKKARVARGFYLVVVPFRSDKPTGRGKGDSSSVKNLSGKTGRGKGGRALKSFGRSLDSRGRGKKGKGRLRSGARDGTSSSQVCFKCGRLISGHVTVRKWTMVFQSEEAQSWSPRLWCVDLQYS